MTRNDDRIREIRKIRFKTMKMGLLGSTETHRGTRWAPNWAFAVREARAGEFEFSGKRRGTRRPIIFHHRGRGEGFKNIQPSTSSAFERISASLGLFQRLLKSYYVV
ncbi:hypothetical protein E3N88_20077 [Mikania micrantha]|uniref:Uncharacterized protein n=1 Tax=Mikania micrantha TaxID=192012 RepID=A0A5N6NGG5_9ASTR|nr:hypothetical protein E3N88_20077 [Mikania micrantha]